MDPIVEKYADGPDKSPDTKVALDAIALTRGLLAQHRLTLQRLAAANDRMDDFAGLLNPTLYRDMLYSPNYKAVIKLCTTTLEYLDKVDAVTETLKKGDAKMLYDEEKFKPLVEDAPIDPWRQHILDAVKIIETRGWCQGKFWDINYARDEAPVCVIGAMHAAAVAGARFGTDWEMIHYQARQQIEYFVGDDIVLWNDKPTNTKANVLKVLREVAMHHQMV